jgi:hypothetical protein
MSLQLKCIDMQQVHTNGVYKLEMVVEKHVNRKRKIKGQNTTQRRTDLLKLDDVEILVYDFNLTKR